MENTELLAMENERFEWSKKTFPEATPISSLRKLESEIREIEFNINIGLKDAVEYADALMCLFDAAQRQGIQIEHILHAYRDKIQVNKQRKWKKNEDNSYSHIKI